MILAIILGITAWRSLPIYTNPITSENIESRVREWALSFGYGVTPVTEAALKKEVEESIFGVTITSPNKGNVQVRTLKRLPSYMVLSASIGLDGEHKKQWDGLSKAAQLKITEQVILDLARAKVAHVVSLPQVIYIDKRVPIYRNLNAAEFMVAVNEVELNTTLAREAFRLSLQDQIRPTRSSR